MNLKASYKGILSRAAAGQYNNMTVMSLQQSVGRRRLISFVFWGFVLAYAAMLLYRPELNLIDDHKFLDTLGIGHLIPPFIEYDLGRFSPLLAQEYNIIAMISHSATAFYAFNVLELLAVSWLLLRIGQSVPDSHYPALPYIVTTAVLLSPGFTVSWFRLWVQEKNELFLFVLFLAAYLAFRARGSALVGFISLLCANLSLYSKESAFIVIGAVGLLGMLLDPAPSIEGPLYRKRWRVFHILLQASCIAFLGIYYGLVYRFRGKHLYGAQQGSVTVLRIHALTASLLHEPLLIPGMILLLYLVFVRNRIRTPAPFKVLLLATALLVVGYAVLGLSNVYYLLPAYFALPYIVTTAAENPAITRSFSRTWLVVIAGVLFVDQSVVAAQQAFFYRSSAENLQAMLPHLEQQLHRPTRINIVLDGMDAGGGGEAFQSLAAFLRADGLTERQFDLLAYKPVEAGSLYVPSPSVFSYSNSSRLRTSHSGDVSLVIPGDSPEERTKFSDRNRYELLFQTTSKSYPNASLKTLFRRILHQPLGADAIVDSNYALFRTKS